MTSYGAGQAAVNASFLSEADDLCSRVMLDICVFDEDKVEGRRTGKMNAKDVRETRLREEDLKLTRDLVKQLRAGKVTASDAALALSKTAYYRTFVGKWDDDDEDLFTNHLKRYCHALRPDSGIAFHETDRYSKALPKSAAVRQTPSPTPPPIADARSPASFIEVGVFATRDFKKGEIVNLRGGVADLSEEEDDKMREGGGRSDFSVLWSERKKCFGLLLGPARFVNHDCRNNVQFHLTGANMTFKVIEDIKADEELFTHYGEHYFDTDNAACMCATCQKLQRGAFTPKLTKAAAKRASLPLQPPRRDTTISSPRRAGRSSLGGHEVTAQRSLGRAPRRASLISDEDKRRSERTSLAPDELRSGPRHIHPRLKPPPIYASDYEWDGRKKIAKYIGIVHVPQSHKSRMPKEKEGKDKKPAIPSNSARTSPVKSKIALGKRKRDDTRSESPSSTPQSNKKKLVISRLVELRKVATGSRASSRAAAGQGSASARSRAFDKLKAAMGGDGDSDESLTDLSSSDDESDDGVLLVEKISDAVKGRGRPIVVVHTTGGRGVELNVKAATDSDDDEVAALLLRQNAPRSSMVPDKIDDPTRAPSPSADPFKEDFTIEGSYARRSPRRDPPPLQAPPAGRRASRLVDGDTQTSSSNGTSAQTTASTSNTTSASGSACDAGVFQNTPS